MIGKIQDWFVNTASGRVAAVLAKVIVSFTAAHAGFLQQWGVTASMDPDKLALAILTGISYAYHKLVHQSNDAPGNN